MRQFEWMPSTWIWIASSVWLHTHELAHQHTEPKKSSPKIHELAISMERLYALSRSIANDNRLCATRRVQTTKCMCWCDGIRGGRDSLMERELWRCPPAALYWFFVHTVWILSSAGRYQLVRFNCDAFERPFAAIKWHCTLADPQTSVWLYPPRPWANTPTYCCTPTCWRAEIQPLLAHFAVLVDCIRKLLRSVCPFFLSFSSHFYDVFLFCARRTACVCWFCMHNNFLCFTSQWRCVFAGRCKKTRNHFNERVW